MHEAIDAVTAHFGGVHALVNNAGISGSTKLTHELTEEEWDRVQAVNVKGVFFCTKHAIPHLKAAGGGSIVNLSSIYGLVGAPDVPAYHASKGAVRLMSKTDAMIYATDRIRGEFNSSRLYLDADGRTPPPRQRRHRHRRRPQRRRQAPSPRPHGRTRRHRLGCGLSCVRRIEVRHRQRTGDRWGVYGEVRDAFQSGHPHPDDAFRYAGMTGVDSTDRRAFGIVSMETCQNIRIPDARLGKSSPVRHDCRIQRKRVLNGHFPG